MDSRLVGMLAVISIDLEAIVLKKKCPHCLVFSSEAKDFLVRLAQEVRA